MITRPLCIVALLLPFVAFSQSKIGVKIYQNSDIYRVDTYNATTKNTAHNTRAEFQRISITLNIATSARFIHEIEISVPEISKAQENILYPMNYTFYDAPNRTTTISAYSARYELSRSYKTSSDRITFNVGVRIRSYLSHKLSIDLTK